MYENVKKSKENTRVNCRNEKLIQVHINENIPPKNNFPCNYDGILNKGYET